MVVKKYYFAKNKQDKIQIGTLLNRRNFNAHQQITTKALL